MPAVALLVGILVVVARAQPLPSGAQPDLDALFAQLAVAPDEATGRQVANLIWEAWMSAGGDEVDEMMRVMREALGRSDIDEAMRLLHRVIEAEPDYAEAWNQRATLYFVLGDYERSLRDIAQTLEREPRHFGALTGRALIRARQGQPELAIRDIRAAMSVHPWVGERNLLPALEAEMRAPQ